MKSDAVRVLCSNSKARFSYEILETLETGIVLDGPEVKSLRDGQGNLKDSYASVHNHEIFLHNFHVSPYAQASYYREDPRRVRKLLLHRREITRLTAKVKEKGLTLVPLKVYLKGNLIKVEIGLAKGKHTHNKKETIKERDVKREVAREVKSWKRG